MESLDDELKPLSPDESSPSGVQVTNGKSNQAMNRWAMLRDALHERGPDVFPAQEINGDKIEHSPVHEPPILQESMARHSRSAPSLVLQEMRGNEPIKRNGFMNFPATEENSSDQCLSPGTLPLSFMHMDDIQSGLNKIKESVADLLIRTHTGVIASAKTFISAQIAKGPYKKRVVFSSLEACGEGHGHAYLLSGEERERAMTTQSEQGVHNPSKIRIELSRSRQFKYWGWRWKDPTYALALWQLCGAVLFFIASTCNLFPQFVPGTRTHMVIIATPFLLGGICYNFGTYHMVIDIVNFGLNSWTPILRSLDFCILGDDNQHVVHSSDYQVVRHFKFFAFQPHRLSWWTAITFFVGSVFFTACYSMSFFIWTPYAERIYVWLPATVGSLFFIIGSALSFLESQHSWQGASDGSGEVLETELIWWISFCNLVGSIQYFVSSFMGFFRDLPGFGFKLEEVELFLGYTLGSAVLALGAYLMVVELVNTQPEIFQEPRQIMKKKRSTPTEDHRDDGADTGSPVELHRTSQSAFSVTAANDPLGTTVQTRRHAPQILFNWNTWTIDTH